MFDRFVGEFMTKRASGLLSNSVGQIINDQLVILRTEWSTFHKNIVTGNPCNKNMIFHFFMKVRNLMDL